MQRRTAASLPLLLYPLISHGTGLSLPPWALVGPGGGSDRPQSPLVRPGAPRSPRTLGPALRPHVHTEPSTPAFPFPPPAQWYSPLLPTAVSGSVLPGGSHGFRFPGAGTEIGTGSRDWDVNLNQNRDREPGAGTGMGI